MCVNQKVIFSAEVWLSNHIYEAFAWDFGFIANKIKVRCDYKAGNREKCWKH